MRTSSRVQKGPARRLLKRSEKMQGGEEILDILARIDIPSVHYVIGNHDFELLHMNERTEGDFPFPITRSARSI